MKIVKVSEQTINDTPHKVDVRKIYDTEKAQAIHIALKPGEALLKHITPVDVFFYVLEGKGIVEIGNEREEVFQDSLIESPAKIPHRLINQSDKIFRFLVVKTPRPTEQTKIL
ncbi:MAG: Cupin domain protein [Candidatus Methanofastidiosum methylothiophilum]|jgi:mannose-6-phosphate isomerase-like protein (cupin superfamily)|uniref:Cupin domain protein n=1 Tax=Candidatus Methanofastidiosum methylothiophilum TaxID=1705564 RepID=A0A150J0A0_9EURY|nr:MAG: Cupin domain protein [Candidatus Methanofastidiosum methylthiophilus]NMC75756.1 cupin domain-containing protein [Candidatus Methanofastidiosa archaeon]